MICAIENQWAAHVFHAAIEMSARDMLANMYVNEEQLAQARQRVLQHWLAQVAPAGVA